MEVVETWKQLLSSSSWLVPALGTVAAIVFSSSFINTFWLLRSLHAATDHMLDLPQAILVLGNTSAFMHQLNKPPAHNYIIMITSVAWCMSPYPEACGRRLECGLALWEH